MNHPFRTQRTRLASVREGLTTAADIVALAELKAEADKARLAARREPEMECEAARCAAERHGNRLGLVVERVTALAGMQVTPALAAAWAAILRGTASAPVAASVVQHAAACTAALSAEADKLASVEYDSGSSSYSDYSDSASDSSSEAGSTEEDDEEEESDAEEPAKPAPTKRRR